MSSTVVVGIFTILGVILGWALNRWQAWRRETQARRNVRLLLWLECRQNVAALMEYWGKVSNEGVHLPGIGMLVGIGTSHEEGAFDKRQRLAREPMPVWGASCGRARRVWWRWRSKTPT